MTTIGRACSGTGLGILAATLAFPILGLFDSGKGWKLEPIFWFAILPLVLPVMAILAGPGAFLLSCVHAVKMESWAPKARSVAHLRKVGILLALPLGVANLILALGLLRLWNGRDDFQLLELAPWLIPALAGGAGLGWGVTRGLRPDRERPRPTLHRARKIRRNGPPFFGTRRGT